MVSVQVEPKSFGKTGQGHDEEIKTVHKTHFDAWDLDVHELASSKDDFWHEPNVQQGIGDGVSVITFEIVGDDGVMTAFG